MLKSDLDSKESFLSGLDFSEKYDVDFLSISIKTNMGIEELKKQFVLIPPSYTPSKCVVS
jgi:hypothetical protein